MSQQHCICDMPNVCVLLVGEIVRAAVFHTGHALRDAVEALRDDADIVRLAVEQDGSSLRYASERLRQDEALAFAAVEQDGQNLQHADKLLRKKKSFVLRCHGSTWSAAEGA